LLVGDVKDRLLQVADKDSRPLGAECSDASWKLLEINEEDAKGSTSVLGQEQSERREERIGTHTVLALPQQLLLSNVVNPQRLSNSGNKTTLERYQRCRHVLDVGLQQRRTMTMSCELEKKGWMRERSLTMCNSSSFLPSSAKVYVRR
jgi:hypothetical protein